MQLKIEQLPIGDLKPYENNAKLHTDEQIQQIKNSIEAFGMNDPIGVWGEDNTIVEGHGRLIACMELGMETVPVIRLDNMTDEQRKAYTNYTHAKAKEGFQLRYIYFIDKSYKERLTVPILPFSKIDELGAGMYKGEKVTQKERHEK